MKTVVRGRVFDKDHKNFKVTLMEDEDFNEWYCCHYKDEIKILIQPSTGIVNIYFEEDKEREVNVRKERGFVKLIDIE